MDGDVEAAAPAAAAAAAAEAGPSTTLPTQPGLVKRRPTAAKRAAHPSSALAAARRPPTWRVKTIGPHWAALRSRWRYLEGMAFYLGPPSHLAARVAPTMALNLAVFALVAADHITEAVSARRAAHADADVAASGGGAHAPVRVGGLLPPLSPSVATSLDPVFRLSLFAVSLLLTLRLGRVVDRWWAARRAFSGLGSVALAIAQRTCLGLDGCGGGPTKPTAAASAAATPRRVGKGEAARWAVVWQASMHQLLTYAPSLHPAAAALLSPAERALYESHPKGRQLAAQRLGQLLLGADGGAAVGGALNAAALLDRGVAAQGELTSIFLQALPSAVTTMSTGATEAFLLLYPLTALTRSGSGGGGVAAAADPAAAAVGASPPRGDVSAMSAMVGGGGHDMSLSSVLFTLGVQGLLYAFVCLLFLCLCATAADLENPYAHIPLESMLRTTVRDVARALDEDVRVRAALDGGGGGGVVGEPNAFDWSEAVRLAGKTAEEKGG